MLQKPKNTGAASAPKIKVGGNAEALAVAGRIADALAEEAKPKLRAGLQELSDLADYLDTVPDDGRFHMDLWGRKVKNECGFRGCAIGWGIHGGVLKGWKWRRTISSGELSPTLPNGENCGTFDPLATHFGIARKEVETCFGPEGHRGPLRDSPKAVAKTIREVVARHVKNGD